MKYIGCTNRPRGYWPQGADVQPAERSAVVPYTIHWDLWVGPSPYRQFRSEYRSFYVERPLDSGSGVFGRTLGAHILINPIGHWSWACRKACTPVLPRSIRRHFH
ncbi:MAG: hypothetical protein U5K69_27210 [Balneolaceae bacterium]|nr:hypothetical protein [Balneolaceae bacterium]